MTPPAFTVDPINTPTPAQLEVIQLRANGLTMREVADHLHLSIDSVKDRTRRMFRQTGFQNMCEACAWWAYRTGREEAT